MISHDIVKYINIILLERIEVKKQNIIMKFCHVFPMSI
jgi:hypothetical protein